MQRTTDFWRTRFLRNGINNNAQTPFLPHVLVEIPGDFNAGWDRITSIGYFNQIGAAPWIVADVSAHEYCHAITQATYNLEYEGQSGAINESLSDIFGTAFERHMFTNGAPGQWNWTIGDDVFTARSMIDPPSIAQGRDQNNQPIFQPDRFQGPNWRPIVPPCGRDNDNCWVHVNSGVMNKWFHTLNTGQGPAGRTTPAVDFDDAINIVYDAQRYYLNRFPNYQDVAWATRLAASVLYNECSPQQRSVIAAWRAVDVPVNNCDGECDFAMGNITVTGSQACNEAITISAGCNGPGCAGVNYFICPPNNGTLSTNNPATFTTPSVAGTYLYQASLFKHRFSPSTCFTIGSSRQITITCAGGIPCDFSSGPRYVGTWYGLTVQIRSISGKNVLVTAITGASNDKYYPRGDNFWGSFSLDPNAAGLQGCLNAGSTGYGGLVIPGGLTPPSGYQQGTEQDGAVLFYQNGSPPPPNPCDFSNPRQVGTWNGLNVQIRQFANGKRTLVTHIPGSSNDKYFPRGDNFWDNFTKNGGAEQYRACLNTNDTPWYGLAFPSGISPPSGYQQGSEQDGAIFFSTNGARVAAPGATLEEVALVHIRPNPAQDEVSVTFRLKAAGSVQVRLLDLQGRMRQQQTYQGAAGPNERVLRIGTLATGLYTLEVNFEGQRVIHKLVKE